jgi:hypothetical protein
MTPHATRQTRRSRRRLAVALAATGIVAVLGVVPQLAASPSSHPNLGTYSGQAVVHRDKHGQVVDTCGVSALLRASGARFQILDCRGSEPFSGCSFALTYVGRAGLGMWKWRISSSGTSVKGRVCASPRSIPRQVVWMSGSSVATTQRFMIRVRGGKVLDTTLEHL